MYYGGNKLIPSKPFGLIGGGVLVRKWIAKQFHEHGRYSEKSATLYIHWPFCAKLCPYCDFNKYVRDEIDHDLMKECFIREFQSLVRMYDVKKINSVYFGGGTPSLARPSTISSILNAVSRECVIKNTTEITLEVNPTATEQSLLRDFKHAGINRVSIGVQALNDEDLKLLGREHSVGDAISCLRHASHLFGNHVSIDLMFGRPGQTPTEWQKELQQVTDMRLNHVSLYELTMKKLTPMGKSFRAGKICLPSDEDMVHMYQDTKEWPFCAKLCPYCDFNKYVRDEIDHDLMKECFIRDFQSLVRMDFKHAGINRVSIGVQALNDEDLKLLGREHSVGDAISCLRHASHLFGNHVSIDLMFGRPGQTPTEWQKELQQVTDMRLNHVSLYELTMKKLTPMGKSFRAGKICLPSDEDMVHMYQDTKEILEAVGLQRYEISNFAKRGYESQHNLSYWCGKDYIGIGPGAHGRLSTFADNKYKHHALVQLPVPEHWINQIRKKGHGIRRCHVLTQQERIDEVIMLSLRTCTGIQSSAFQELVGWSYHLLKEDEIIQQSIRNDLLVIDTRGLRITEKGMIVVDAVVTEVCIAIQKANMEKYASKVA